ncbi:MAG: CehA/McbA family metallohydrolase [Pseudomonadota bacterium]
MSPRLMGAENRLAALPPAEDGPLYDYRGAVHIHSAHSHDGRRTVAEIATAARKCGLDFVLLTDHFNLKAKAEGEDGWRDKVLVVTGEEISPRYNHLLVFGINEPLLPQAGEPVQALIDRVRAAGGICFIAHPDHKGARFFGVQSYRWTDWSVNGFAGLSVWDTMTDWQNRLRSIVRSLVAYASPALALRGPEPETLARWDALGQERPVAGFGEMDNHEFHRRLFGLNFKIFSFETAFRLVLTHVLLERPFLGRAAPDEAALLRALAAGRAYVCLEALGDGRGFQFWANVGGRRVHMGEEAVLGEKTPAAKILAKTPQDCRLTLLRDGRPQAEVCWGRELCHKDAAAGVWRLECRRRKWGKWRPWIYSNPLYLRHA